MTDCPHATSDRVATVLNADDPEWAYCTRCLCVVHLEDHVWVTQGPPGQITKATYQMARRRRKK